METTEVMDPKKVQAGKVIYTAFTKTSGGREHGVSRSSDGNLDVKLSSPGSGLAGTNPEQLFAAGWSACFEAAMEIVARRMKLTLPVDMVINTEVDLCLDKGEFSLQVRFNISIPGMDREVGEAIAHGAHQICPYSKATRGNIEVQINVL